GIEPSVERDLAGRLESVEDRHPDVHQDHIGIRLARKLDGVAAVFRLADDLDAVLGVEQGAEPGAHERLVVCQQYADHGTPPIGRWADTRKPPPGPVPASSRPPSATARSRIPAIPLPPLAAAPPRPSSSLSTVSSRSPQARIPLAPVSPAPRATFVTG